MAVPFLAGIGAKLGGATTLRTAALGLGAERLLDPRQARESSQGWVEAAAALETYRQTIAATEATAADADIRLAQLLSLGERLVGIDVGGLIKFNSQLRAGGLEAEKVDMVLSGVVKSTAELGRGTHEAAATLRQLTDAINQNSLTTVDWRIIMGYIPQVSEAAATALGRPIKGANDFKAAAKDLNLEVRDALLLTLEELNKAAKGANLESYAAQMEILSESTFKLKATLGEPLKDAITPVIKNLNQSLQGLTRGIDEFINGKSQIQDTEGFLKATEAGRLQRFNVGQGETSFQMTEAQFKAAFPEEWKRQQDARLAGTEKSRAAFAAFEGSSYRDFEYLQVNDPAGAAGRLATFRNQRAAANQNILGILDGRDKSPEAFNRLQALQKEIEDLERKIGLEEKLLRVYEAQQREQQRIAEAQQREQQRAEAARQRTLPRPGFRTNLQEDKWKEIGGRTGTRRPLVGLERESPLMTDEELAEFNQNRNRYTESPNLLQQERRAYLVRNRLIAPPPIPGAFRDPDQEQRFEDSERWYEDYQKKKTENERNILRLQRLQVRTTERLFTTLSEGLLNAARGTEELDQVFKRVFEQTLRDVSRSAIRSLLSGQDFGGLGRQAANLFGGGAGALGVAGALFPTEFSNLFSGISSGIQNIFKLVIGGKEVDLIAHETQLRRNEGLLVGGGS